MRLVRDLHQDREFVHGIRAAVDDNLVVRLDLCTRPLEDRVELAAHDRFGLGPHPAVRGAHAAAQHRACRDDVRRVAGLQRAEHQCERSTFASVGGASCSFAASSCEAPNSPLQPNAPNEPTIIATATKMPR